MHLQLHASEINQVTFFRTQQLCNSSIQQPTHIYFGHLMLIFEYELLLRGLHRHNALIDFQLCYCDTPNRERMLLYGFVPLLVLIFQCVWFHIMYLCFCFIQNIRDFHLVIACMQSYTLNITTVKGFETFMEGLTNKNFRSNTCGSVVDLVLSCVDNYEARMVVNQVIATAITKYICFIF